MNSPIPSSWAPVVQSLLRIAAALSFMTHGTQKLFGWPGDGPARPFDLASQFAWAGLLETFGGMLLLLGLLTKPVAFLLSGEMAVAYFQAHGPRNFWPMLNGGEPAMLFCFIFLFLAAAGPGPLSLDALWRRSGGSSGADTKRGR